MARPNKYFVHPQALVDSSEVGEGTRVWAFAHVMEGARVGKRCNIGEHCFIENGAEIADDVVVKNGVSVWRGVRIESQVLVGPNVAFTNDKFPRAKLFRAEYERTIIRRGASIGANATLLSGIEVGEYALIGAGSTVTGSVPPYAVVFGVPARVRGYICRCGTPLKFHSGRTRCDCGESYWKRGRVIRPA